MLVAPSSSYNNQLRVRPLIVWGWQKNHKEIVWAFLRKWNGGSQKKKKKKERKKKERKKEKEKRKKEKFLEIHTMPSR